jgi:hypothetical protein
LRRIKGELTKADGQAIAEQQTQRDFGTGNKQQRRKGHQ